MRDRRSEDADTSADPRVAAAWRSFSARLSAQEGRTDAPAPRRSAASRPAPAFPADQESTYLIVVRRGESRLYEALKQTLGGHIVWDRRVGDRRLARRPVAVERRNGERRGPPAGPLVDRPVLVTRRSTSPAH